MEQANRRDIVVIAASAGGVGALQILCAGLPKDLASAVLIVQHVSPSAKSMLPAILGRTASLPVIHPAEGDAIRSGQIYVAPPDRHLLVRQGYLLVRRGPKENRTRPAADPLFRSAAAAYGSRVVGLVLTGTLDDGTAGLLAVKRCGGIAAVQDPDDAAWPDMPRHAMQKVAVDHCLPLDRLADLIRRLSLEPAGPQPPIPADIELEARIAEQEMIAMIEETENNSLSGRPALITCPDCGGAMMEVMDGPLLRFRCHIGHAYSPATLAEAQAEAFEQALAMALRTHHERIKLFERMAENATAHGQHHAAAKWTAAAEEARGHVDVLRTVLSNQSPAGGITPEAG
ncbi:chemotaxis protein CheB [Skermanella sp. TT6]|uniref:protein-glutamate methylesterase n=1 Tax=Skermanella cutis TaxID=2775420 RepID=A0ABX7B9A6_9PROT|nr:chemotaxis protein CheB [Skermanella sp. TT6]QQP90724.1 chemotaxis protein CheB [Skermanella sp. TT6]